MESYVVRIYRKEEDNPRLLVGIVEETGRNGKKAFNNIHELWEIINPLNNRPKREKKKRK